LGLQQKLFMMATALAAAVCVVYLQQRFDAADMKNCVAIARTYRAPSGRGLPDVLAERHPGATVDWGGNETSSCFQHVRVDAHVTPKDGAPVVYEFDVDLNGPSIHPANPLGVEALEALDSPGTDGGGG
jgi:hypothetical protein